VRADWGGRTRPKVAHPVVNVIRLIGISAAPEAAGVNNASAVATASARAHDLI